MPRTSVATVLRKFKKNGFVNPKKAVNRCGGRQRKMIGSAELEQELLSNKVLQKMAPLSINRRRDYIRQKYGVEATHWQLRLLYRKNHLTFRVSSRSWKISEEELANLNE